MGSKKRWGICVAALTTTVVIAGCSSGGGSANTAAAGGKASCPINILLVDNFSGSGSQNGSANLAGENVAINDVNKSGGVLGCKLKLTTVDDNSNYNTTLPLLEAALARQKYPLVSVSDYSATSVAPYLNRQKVLTIGGASSVQFSEPGGPYPYDFDTNFVTAKPDLAALNYLIGKGYKRVAVIVDNTSTGASDLKAMTPVAKSAGVTITDTERIDLSGVDFASAVERARASNPDALLYDASYTAAAHLETDIHNSGWKIPVVAGMTASATNFQGLVPESYLTGQFIFGPASMAYPSKGSMQNFVTALKNSGVNVNQFLFGYSTQYDAVIEFAWAANKTHSLDAQTLANYLHQHGSATVPGLAGGTSTGYTPTSGEWNGQLAMMRAGFYSDGRLVSVGAYINAPDLPAGFFS